MITADQLLLHAIGDYIIQSNWMATEKTKRSLAALIHAVTYTLPFLLLTLSWPALTVICSTHFIIDHRRLARYLIWARNWVGIPDMVQHYPGDWTPVWDSVNKPWAECKATGFTPSTPPWLATWLMIFTDNILHVIINGMAIAWF